MGRRPVEPGSVEVGTLWATMVKRFDFDPKSKTCAIVLTVEGTTQIKHTLAADGVRHLRFFDGYENSGEVLEATEVFVGREGNDLRLTIEFWGPEAGLELVARALTLDGVPMDPTAIRSSDIRRR